MANTQGLKQYAVPALAVALSAAIVLPIFYWVIPDPARPAVGTISMLLYVFLSVEGIRRSQRRIEEKLGIGKDTR